MRSCYLRNAVIFTIGKTLPTKFIFNFFESNVRFIFFFILLTFSIVWWRATSLTISFILSLIRNMQCFIFLTNIISTLFFNSIPFVVVPWICYFCSIHSRNSYFFFNSKCFIWINCLYFVDTFNFIFRLFSQEFIDSFFLYYFTIL